MRRLLAVITAAAARPENATAYFDAAETLWPPASTAGRCLAHQRNYGFRPKPKGSNFKTLGAFSRLCTISGCLEGRVLSKWRQYD